MKYKLVTKHVNKLPFQSLFTSIGVESFFKLPSVKDRNSIVNLIFVNILKNEECANEREKCCRKNLIHKTLKKKTLKK